MTKNRLTRNYAAVGIFKAISLALLIKGIADKKKATR